MPTTVYVTRADVRKHLPQGVKIEDFSSAPGQASLDTLITDVSSQVTVALTSGNAAVPVTDEDNLNAIRVKVAREIVWQLMAIRGTKVQHGEAGESPLWSRWHSEFEKWLEKVAEGLYTSADTDAGNPESYTMGAEEDEDNDDIQPVFQRGKRY